MSAELVQRSPEWHAARVGSLGASCVHEIVARTKAGWGTSRANRLSALVIERLTGQPQGMLYTNAAIQQGIEREPAAREWYAYTQDVTVREVGLITHPGIKWTHASPDGMIDEGDGLVELKCPQPAEHLRFLLEGTVPEKYLIQCLWQMACTGRGWDDYVSYNPDFPLHLRGKIVRIPRDDARIRDLESAVIAFLMEVDAAVKRLTEKAA